MSGRPFSRALVVRGGALGDFLLSLPAIASMRAASPDARIEVLAYPGIAALAGDSGLVDAVRPIEYAPLARFFTRGGAMDPELREYFASFDTIVSYLYDPDGIFAENLRASGVRRLVIGPHRPAETSHAIDQFATPLAELGISFSRRALRLSLHPEKYPTPVIALHPGSGSPRKNWPATRWARVAKTLLETYPQTRVAVVAGEADQAALDEMRELTMEKNVECWRDLPLPQLARRLAGASAYLGHDTGVSHLAALCGTPSLLLFGPTDPGVWAPPHDHVAILRAPGGELAALPTDTVLAAASRLVSDALLASGAGGDNNARR
ncbi:MAG: glycosyltransferase family 9 protein [Chthoniobacterales bacterium]|nr:glycosyltransferase family 9 protein [Chthoniobacterales bacterium]